MFIEKLSGFSDFAFVDEAVFGRRARWRTSFGDRIGPGFDGRVIFEIGCADGELLTRIAAKHPTTAFVGLDWKCRGVCEAAERVRGAGLRNVALLLGRAQDLARIFGDGELDEVWVFHPDPCDREAELKNRLISERFLVDVHRVLRSDASILALKTDHPGYYRSVLELMESDSLRRGFEMTIHSADYWGDDAAQKHTARRGFAGDMTTYERKFFKKREPIFYVELRKRSDLASA